MSKLVLAEPEPGHVLLNLNLTVVASTNSQPAKTPTNCCPSPVADPTAIVPAAAPSSAAATTGEP